MSQPMPFASPRPSKGRSGGGFGGGGHMAKSPSASLNPSFMNMETPPRPTPPAPILIPGDSDDEVHEDEDGQRRRPHQAPLEQGQDWSRPLTDTPLARARQRPDFKPLVSEEEREVLRTNLKEGQQQQQQADDLEFDEADEALLQQNQLPPSALQSPGEFRLLMKTRPSRASSMGAGSPRVFRPIGLAQIQIPDEDQQQQASDSPCGERSQNQAPLVLGQDWSVPLTETPLARAKKRPDFQPLVSEEERERLRRSIVLEDDDDSNSKLGLDELEGQLAEASLAPADAEPAAAQE